MSNEYKVPPAIRKFLDQCYAIEKHFPTLSRFLGDDDGDFRGFSLLVGNRGGYLLILKRFGHDGRPEVQFHNGTTPLETFVAAEKCLANGSWREDKQR